MLTLDQGRLVLAAGCFGTCPARPRWRSRHDPPAGPVRRRAPRRRPPLASPRGRIRRGRRVTAAAQSASAQVRQAHPLLRLLRIARPLRGQLVLAVLAGAASTGCAVALLATSGFLLARAAQHPNIVAISVAVVAVRGLSVGRGVFRYGERLSSHDAAFRVLADVRVRVYQRLERLAPACASSGPVTCWPAWSATWTPPRICSSADHPAADRVPGRRGRGHRRHDHPGPGGRGAGRRRWWPGWPCPGWPPHAPAVPPGAPLLPRRAQRPRHRPAGRRSDLHAFGAQDAALARSDAADEELTRLARTTAAGAALGSGLSQAVAGLTLWGVLVLGVAAVGSGTMSQVPLAVITLTALAAFEAVTGLPAAAIALGHARSSAARVGGVLDAPDRLRRRARAAAAGRPACRPAARRPGTVRARRAAGPRRRGPRPGRLPPGGPGRAERGR